jgi:SAM-dependent methyltransferase
MKKILSILIPTWNNPQFLTPCVNSIIRTDVLNDLANLIIINNGKQPIKEEFKHVKEITVLEPGENLGWERGLALGLQHTDSPFVCFQNDDTYIPYANKDFYRELLYPFKHPNVAAVGPATTTAAGWHSVYSNSPLTRRTEVSFLIFFTAMLSRKELDDVGGIDLDCPGGDDIDLSIRLRKAGKHLVVNPNAFLIHHGFKSGERLRGDSSTPGGWNSPEMRDTTNAYLIQKHGFKAYFETIRGLRLVPDVMPEDKEGRIVRQMVEGQKVLEMGCGGAKTVEHAVGVDISPKDEEVPHLHGEHSVADIVADVSKDLPVEPLSQDTVIARHILEHCVDTLQTLRHWNKVLKIGGRLIIAVPNQDKCNSIPMNPEHVHAFTPSSLKSLVELSGFKQLSWQDPEDTLFFVACFEKVLHLDQIKNGKTLETVNA